MAKGKERDEYLARQRELEIQIEQLEMGPQYLEQRDALRNEYDKLRAWAEGHLPKVHRGIWRPTEILKEVGYDG